MRASCQIGPDPPVTLKLDLQAALEATLLRGEAFDAGTFLAQVDDRPASERATDASTGSDTHAPQGRSHPARPPKARTEPIFSWP